MFSNKNPPVQQSLYRPKDVLPRGQISDKPTVGHLMYDPRIRRGPTLAVSIFNLWYIISYEWNNVKQKIKSTFWCLSLLPCFYNVGRIFPNISIYLNNIKYVIYLLVLIISFFFELFI